MAIENEMHIIAIQSDEFVNRLESKLGIPLELCSKLTVIFELGQPVRLVADTFAGTSLAYTLIKAIEEAEIV